MVAGTVLHGVLVSLSSILDNGAGKMKIIQELRKGEAQLNKIFEEVRYARAREELTNVLSEIGKLIANLSADGDNLNIVRIFIKNARESVPALIRYTTFVVNNFDY